MESLEQTIQDTADALFTETNVFEAKYPCQTATLQLCAIRHDLAATWKASKVPRVHRVGVARKQQIDYDRHQDR